MPTIKQLVTKGLPEGTVVVGLSKRDYGRGRRGGIYTRAIRAPLDPNVAGRRYDVFAAEVRAPGEEPTVQRLTSTNMFDITGPRRNRTDLPSHDGFSQLYVLGSPTWKRVMRHLKQEGVEVTFGTDPGGRLDEVRVTVGGVEQRHISGPVPAHVVRREKSLVGSARKEGR